MGFGRDGKGVVIKGDSGPTALGTLAAKTALQVALFPVTEDFRLLKLESHWTGRQFTVPDDQVLIGIADAELSVAEIAESINADGPNGRNDNLGMEQAERPVWLLEGVLPGINNSNDGTTGYIYNEWKKRWTFSDPDGFQFFVWNPDIDPLVTGSAVGVIFTGYGVWVS